MKKILIESEKNFDCEWKILVVSEKISIVSVKFWLRVKNFGWEWKNFDCEWKILVMSEKILAVSEKNWLNGSFWLIFAIFSLSFPIPHYLFTMFPYLSLRSNGSNGSFLLTGLTLFLVQMVQMVQMVHFC